MNLKNETEAQIVFISEKVKSLHSKFFDFCENIGEKVLNPFERKNGHRLPSEEMLEYKKSVKTLWRESGRKILSTAATALAIIAMCTVVNLLGWSLG